MAIHRGIAGHATVDDQDVERCGALRWCRRQSLKP